MLSRRRATAVVSANWWDGGRLEHLVGPLALHTYVAPALHTPRGSALHGFGSALSMGCAHLHGFGSARSMACAHPHGFCSAHSMGTAHFPCLWLCTLHGAPPHTPRGFGSAHSMGSSAHSHRFYYVAPRRHITKSPFHSAIAQFKRPNAMLSRRRTTEVVSANWWDGGRLEHLVRPHAKPQKTLLRCV